MTETFHGWAATQAGQALTQLEFNPGEMRPEQVQVKIESCGICHSDLSMLDNDWGNSTYPLIPGHEVVGIIEKVGDQAKGLATGSGWAGLPAAAFPASPVYQGNTIFVPAPSR